MAGAASYTDVDLRLACLLLFVGLVPTTLVVADGEADVLLEFKSGITDNAGALKSWSAGTSAPCTAGNDPTAWSGVICDGGRVLGLQLEGMGLSGALDLRPLRDLRSLRTLSFMNNKFEGPMPEVRELGGLRSVYLSSNNFSGKIPADAFDGMDSLKKVFLSQNDFSGPIPESLAAVPRLLELRLDGNAFDGEIPDLRQEELQVVNVSNNALEGKIPDRLASTKPDLFAGNKNLCGAPLDVKCSTASPPARNSDASSADSSSPSPAAAAAAADVGNAKSSGSSMTVSLLIAFIGTLAVVGVAVVAMQRRREPRRDQKLGGQEAGGGGGGGRKAVSMKEEQGRVEGGEFSMGGGSTAARNRTAEQGRLTFVREEERGRFFELQDLLKSSAEVLGAGNLGCTYRATLMNGPSMVVKRFREMNRVGREDFEEHMRRLGRLSHPNLLPLVAYYYRKEEKLLITDFLHNKSLAHLLHGDGLGAKKAASLDWSARLKIVKGVANALGYLYDELPMLTVPHGHLKSPNILLDECFEPLLTDYALAPVMNQSHAAQLMVAFKSPERKQFGRSSKKSDVWCLGLLILEILTGKPPSYDHQPKAAAAGADLVAVVNSTPEQGWLASVVDADLLRCEDGDRIEILKLMKIGLACCEPNVDKRWELKDAVERIEELKANDDDPSSLSRADRGGASEQDFATVAID